MKMNQIKFAPILCALCFFCISHTMAQEVFSLNPLFTEQDAVLIPEMEGSWIIDDEWTMSLRKKGVNFYHLLEDVRDLNYNHEIAFTKIKSELFIDLSGILPPGYGEGFLPFHSIYKAKLSTDTLYVSSLNYSWLYDYGVKKKLPLEFEWVSKGMLLTYTTEELRSFLAEHSDDEGIFTDPDIIIIDKDQFVKKKDIVRDNALLNSAGSITQKCEPTFPFADGWLGGDGDVSVPLNDTTTVFVFSDTYVGRRDQKNRQEPGMRMVSNTVSLQRCLPDGGTEVQYYWNNMHTDNPEPFFRSFTDRYKYWVVDAFTAKTNLYVILSKIGPLLGSPPDNIFKFSGLGFTLAKISNPLDSPDDWKIDLLPLNGFNSSTMAITCHAKHDGYVYLFINRNDSSQFLVRKRIENIDKPEIPFKYYALNKQWKEGANPDDMLEILKGFRCNSVNFHPDIKKWVMINDIMFLSNKIEMRSAPLLTGPWSEEIVIYEIPEMTPGSPLFSKSNYCYLAREHLQYYDSANHTMYITYDINSKDFSELISNPKIYTPKVIRVLLY